MRVFIIIRLNLIKIIYLSHIITSKLAELKDVTENQISRAKRWSHNQITGCYLICLPHDFMRRMGGYSAQKDYFKIKRAIIKLSDKLLALI